MPTNVKLKTINTCIKKKNTKYRKKKSRKHTSTKNKVENKQIKI
jgi:hypothetical protein